MNSSPRKWLSALDVTSAFAGHRVARGLSTAWALTLLSAPLVAFGVALAFTGHSLPGVVVLATTPAAGIAAVLREFLITRGSDPPSATMTGQPDQQPEAAPPSTAER